MRMNLKFKDIYIILYAIFVFVNILELSLIEIGIVYILINVGCMLALTVLYLMRKNYNTRRIAAVVVILFVILTSTWITKSFRLAACAFFIVSAENIDFSRLVRTCLITVCIALFIIFVCSVTGMIPDYTYPHNGQTAHSYGFYYYSSFPYYMLFVCLMYLYLRAKSITWLELVCIVAINYAVYKVFTVRLVLYIFLLVIALFVLMVKLRLFRVSKQPFRLAAYITFTALFILAVVCTLKYDPSNHTWLKLDEILSNRLMMSKQAMDEFKPTLFGQYIEMHGNASIAVGNYKGEYFYIDSGYIYSLLCNGVLFSALITAMYTYLMVQASRRGNKPMYIWLIAVAVFSLVNNTWVDIYYNPALLCFMTVFGSEKSKRRRRLHVVLK